VLTNGHLVLVLITLGAVLPAPTYLHGTVLN